jgi:hypothetical protein
MFKKLIQYLYKRYCISDCKAFFIEKKEYTKEEEQVMYKECLIMIKTGILQNVVDMVYADSESEQLYNRTIDPKQELDARMGIERLMDKIKSLANKVPKEGAEFDKNAAL